jgi:predicted nucleic-acid-binding Zn-ribbon protein
MQKGFEKTMQCPKCSGEMDEGRVSADDKLYYVSDRQSGTFKVATPVRKSKACLSCGYVELYLDAAELKQRLLP